MAAAKSESHLYRGVHGLFFQVDPSGDFGVDVRLCRGLHLLACGDAAGHFLSHRLVNVGRCLLKLHVEMVFQEHSETGM